MPSRVTAALLAITSACAPRPPGPAPTPAPLAPPSTPSARFLAPTEDVDALPDVAVSLDVRIPMRDGVTLGATVYRPRGTTDKLPVVFDVTPYVADTNHPWAVYYARHGYAAAAVDIRGRGDSGGTFDPYHAHRMDMTDAVLWLAGQPWSNGQVAMMGGSYLGMTQWWTAREAPPPLATIVPIASVCMGMDFPMSDGIPGIDDLAWLAYVAGRSAHPKLGDDDEFWRRAAAGFVEARLPFRELDSFVGTPSKAFQDELAHPTYDAFWRSSRPTPAEYAAMKQSVLTITGDYDDDQLGALTYYRDHTQYGAPSVAAEHYLVIGPWDHAGTREPKQTFGGLRFGEASLVDIKKLGKEWSDWRMKGGARPALLADRVAYYVAGPHAERWRYAHTLEAVTKVRAQFFLGSVGGVATGLLHSGSLAVSRPDRSRASGSDAYVYDPRDVAYADRVRHAHHDDDWATTEDGLADLHGQALVYHSDPLPEETELAGTMRLSVWLAMDVPDTDIYASVYEITPEGGSILLGVDGIRARYRESLERETLVSPGVALRYDFDHFRFLGRRLARGSRLRLVVGAPNSSGIVWLTCGGTPCTVEKNYNSGGAVADESAKDARVAHVTLLHDEGHASVLEVPVSSAGSEGPPRTVRTLPSPPRAGPHRACARPRPTSRAIASIAAAENLAGGGTGSP